MKEKTPQEKGRDFEKVIAKKVGGKLQPGSGNTPLKKLDISGSSFIVSCKWTEKQSLTLDRHTLREAERHSHGPGSIDAVPIHISRVAAGEGASERVYATLDLEDLISLLQERTKLFKEDKTSQKYREAETPEIFRD